jgi:hypothetical protein
MFNTIPIATDADASSRAPGLGMFVAIACSMQGLLLSVAADPQRVHAM